MRSTDPRHGDAGRRLPQFRLDYLVDDEDDPEQFTLVPGTGTDAIGTRWITVDADSAIPIDTVR